jgi:hypothetical protein
MYERMLNKNIIPSENDIKEHIGKKSFENIELIKRGLGKIFNINFELKFPFGNNYGWGYKFSDGKKHLFYLFFEKNSITIMLQIKGIKTEREIENYNKLSEEGKNYWKNRYPCGENGGWIHYRIINKKQLKDIENFLTIRTNKKIKIYDN